jgi:tyrosyl-DNA phosphodiesterase 2
MYRALTLISTAVVLLCLIACDGPSPELPAADPPQRQAVAARTLTVLTYNVLADRVAEDARVPALLKLIEQADADIIALQEVTSWFLEALMQAPWVRDGYHTTMHDGEAAAVRGLFILSRFPITRTYANLLPGGQGRAILAVALDVDGREMRVATVHMESPLDQGPVRARQLDMVFELIGGAEQAILLGDLNFGDREQPETEHLHKDFIDVWRTLRPAEPGYTWNMEQSEMAKRGSFPNETSRRIDRILVKSKLFKPKSIRIIGSTPVTADQPGVFPSDHFGLVGRLEERP